MNRRITISVRSQNNLIPTEKEVFCTEDYDNDSQMAKHIFAYIKQELRNLNEDEDDNS